MQAGYLEAAGARLFFETAGAGPALALLHAGIADHTMWEGSFERFAAGRRVLRYDLRGFGKSVGEAVTFSHADDLIRLLDHVGIERAALVGVSFSTRVALAAALDYPERVAALVLTSPSLAGVEHQHSAVERELLANDDALAEAEDWEGMADNDVALWVDGPGQPRGRAPAWLRWKVKAMALGGYVDYARRYPREELEPVEGRPEPPLLARLAEVRAPTLIVVGALDTGVTLATAAALEAGIAGARKVVLPDVTHLPPMEAPVRFEEQLQGFLGPHDRP